MEAEPPQPITIRIPPMGGIRDALPTAPMAVAVDIPETAPLRYEQVPLSGPTSTSQSTDDDKGLRGTGWGDGGPVYLET